MAQPRIFWQPASFTLDSVGTKRLTDISDGDTPKIEVPIRMLSIDTPETFGNPEGKDPELTELGHWLDTEIDRLPVDRGLAAYLAPRLKTGDAGSRQERQGREATAHFTAITDTRLTRDTGSRRSLFVRVADQPFDRYGRLLAYCAPSYSREERMAMSRRERATFNFDMIASGWAASFILYPNIPNEIDLPMVHEAAAEAVRDKKGAWADPQVLTGYEYRMAVRLHEVAKDILDGVDVSSRRRFGWVSRYCADMTTLELHRPQHYYKVAPENRLFLWSEDVRRAVADLNLVPAA
jgi:endonuclease YncB( thermonuclease family)